MTDGSRAAALKGTVFHRTHMGSFRPMGGRMPEGGCRREDARGRRPEAGGWRPEAGGQSQRPEAGQGGVVGWTYGRTYGCNQETIRCDLHRMYHSTIAVHEKVKNLFFLRDKKVHFFFVPEAILGKFWVTNL